MPKDKQHNDDIFDQTAAPEVDPMDRQRIEDETDAAEVAREAAGTTTGYSAPDDDKDPDQPEDGEDDDDDQTGDLDDGDFFINMAKADEKIKPMEIGTRLIVSCSAADAKISASANPMIALRVTVERVVSTPNASTITTSYRKRSVRDNLLFIPPNEETGYRGTIWRANQAMRAFGVEPDHGEYRSRAAFMAMLQTKAAELRGAVAEIEVGIEMNDGSDGREIQRDGSGEPYPPKNTIVRYYPYSPPAAPPVEDLPF